MTNKTITMIAIAIAGAFGVANAALLGRTNRVVGAIDKMADRMNVSIPDILVEKAMTKAADKEAGKAAAGVRNLAEEKIGFAIEAEVACITDELEDSVRTEFKKKLSVLDVEEIKADIAKEAGRIIAADMVAPVADSSETAQIIRACTEAKLSAWDIQNILESAKN